MLFLFALIINFNDCCLNAMKLPLNGISFVRQNVLDRILLDQQREEAVFLNDKTDKTRDISKKQIQNHPNQPKQPKQQQS